jgi:hypothetical protein
MEIFKALTAVGGRTEVAPSSHLSGRLRPMSQPDADPVPRRLVPNLEEAFRVLEALEDARLAMRETGLAPGLQDELATVIRMIHGRLGFEEGGVP